MSTTRKMLKLENAQLRDMVAASTHMSRTKRAQRLAELNADQAMLKAQNAALRRELDAQATRAHELEIALERTAADLAKHTQPQQQQMG